MRQAKGATAPPKHERTMRHETPQPKIRHGQRRRKQAPRTENRRPQHRRHRRQQARFPRKNPRATRKRTRPGIGRREHRRSETRNTAPLNVHVVHAHAHGRKRQEGCTSDGADSSAHRDTRRRAHVEVEAHDDTHNVATADARPTHQQQPAPARDQQRDPHVAGEHKRAREEEPQTTKWDTQRSGGSTSSNGWQQRR
jgi:hypothetical protein